LSEIAVAVAAGGSSSRLGSPKPLLDLGGATLLEYALECAYSISSDVYLLLNDAGQVRRILGAERVPAIVTDPALSTFPDRIAESLRKIPSELVFLMGCDMPFLDPRLPPILASRIEGHGAAVPAWQNRHLEPLSALYRRSALPSRHGIGSMRQLCMVMDPILVAIEGTGVPSWTFLNINTKEDLLKAEAVLRSSQSQRSSCGKSNIPQCPKSSCL